MSSSMPSTEIPVSEFRQILLCPLAMAHPYLAECRAGMAPPWRDTREIVTDIARRIESHAGAKWRRVTDRKDFYPGAADDRQRYAEFVYFQTYIQQFLYGQDPAGADSRARPPFHLFRRDDIIGLHVTLRYRDDDLKPPGFGPFVRYTLDVDRLLFYLFENGIAMLALEVATRKRTDAGSPGLAVFRAPAAREHRLGAMPLDKAFFTDIGIDDLAPEENIDDPPPVARLSDVQLHIDHFRRLYPPYFGDAGDMRVPVEVTWLTRGGSDDESRNEHVFHPLCPAGDGDNGAGPPANGRDPAFYCVCACPPENRRPVLPMFDHWRVLLPVNLEGDAALETRNGILTHCLIGMDERAWRRCAAEPVWRPLPDERMASLFYLHIPNATARLSRGDWVRLCFADSPGRGLPYSAAFLEDFEKRHCYDRYFEYGTRQVFAGYNWGLIGSGGRFQKNLKIQFRTMYAQMGLLAHIQKASILNCSDWIAGATELSDPDLRHNRRFEEAFLQIERETLRFIHRAWFVSISNQMQATEMYDLWRGHLELPRLHEEATAQLARTNDLLTGIRQTEQGEDAAALNVIALFATVLGLPLAFLGMNSLIPTPGGGAGASTGNFNFAGFADWAMLAMLTGWVAILALAMLGVRAGGHRRPLAFPPWADTVLRMLAIIGLDAGLVVFGIPGGLINALAGVVVAAVPDIVALLAGPRPAPERGWRRWVRTALFVLAATASVTLFAACMLAR